MRRTRSSSPDVLPEGERDLRAALRPLTAPIARSLADGIAAGVVRTAPPHRLAMLVYNLVSTTTRAERLAQDATARSAPDSRRAMR